ncbi:hypothetical protein GQ54DRAFT_300236 [Martensiomyces pterosporus]|nr:hypothetical protein GQ54DRAFT_300236 [Martensiomyces pterosporus]
MPSIPKFVASSKSPPTAGGRVLVGRELCRVRSSSEWIACVLAIDSHECFAAVPHAWSAAELPKSDNQSASAPLSTPTTTSDLAKETLSS